MAAETRARLHRIARLATAGAFLLVLAGGLVTSRDAGLAVPDWPLAFGQINPPGWWRMENVRTEHGHRIIAFFVACWTAYLLVQVLRLESDRLIRRLAISASALVILQAGLGGLRVLHLSLNLAMVHGVVGQLFFANLAALAAVTAPSWRATEGLPQPRHERAQSLVLLGLVFAQLLLGLFIRHLGAEARPLEGSWLFYAHVIGAGLVLSALLDLLRDSEAMAPGTRWLLPITSAQIALGIATYVTTGDMTFDRQATMLESWLPTLHVGFGAALLGATVVRSMHAWRSSISTGELAAPQGALRRAA